MIKTIENAKQRKLNRTQSNRLSCNRDKIFTMNGRFFFGKKAKRKKTQRGNTMNAPIICQQMLSKN